MIILGLYVPRYQAVDLFLIVFVGHFFDNVLVTALG